MMYMVFALSLNYVFYNCMHYTILQCVCVCVCVRACVRVCVRACVRACEWSGYAGNS